ncbi:hypothetical protein ACFWFH_12130 [Streptomyces coelicoflavus]|uniref:hypothetical protein n=1 Tax=Streptomyces TaxID=1883 RepID=UPI00129103BB|nr:MULTISPECIES: hypothetical protein [unclassified Streptomyces]MBQ0951304.1 hypothetical protein [Streptomyces sp. RK76]QFX86682.1 hypothetical protein GEV49_37995 [Streptomyces sp. SYP-A7193]
MAGTMNKACVHHRPLLTEYLLLGTPLPEELFRHLHQCPDCAREATEIDDVGRTMRRVDAFARWKAAPHGPVPSVNGTAAPRPARTGPGKRIALGFAAALVAAAAVAVPLGSAHEQGADPKLSTAAIRYGEMIGRPWGTEVPVVLSGLSSGETYRLTTVGADGARAVGGSVQAASAERFTFRIVTSMDKDTITELIVEDGEGHVIARVPVCPCSV